MQSLQSRRIQPVSAEKFSYAIMRCDKLFYIIQGKERKNSQTYYDPCGTTDKWQMNNAAYAQKNDENNKRNSHIAAVMRTVAVHIDCTFRETVDAVGNDSQKKHSKEHDKFRIIRMEYQWHYARKKYLPDDQ